RAMQLDAVKADLARINGCLCEGLDRVLDLLTRHRFGALLARHGKPGWTVAREMRIGGLFRVTGHARVPELRHDLAANAVNFLNHALPAFQRVLAPKLRYVGVACCNRRVD